MPVMTKDDRAVLFVHIPKTGGSSIEKLFTDSGWTVHMRITPASRPRLFPTLRVSPQHYHATLLTELFRLDRFELIFGISREPVARFRSEFAMRNTKLEHGDEARVEAWADDVFARYAADPYVHDNHLRPQVDFLVPGTQVYRLEDGMDQMVADLNGRHSLGLDAPLAHSLRSDERGLSSSRVDVSDRLRARLLDFYAADVDRFGYRA